jgi:hypothetical protein
MNLNTARATIQSKPPRQSFALTVYEVIAMVLAAMLLQLFF